MKKLIPLIVLIQFFVSSAQSQPKLDDFGRIILNTYLSDKINLPTESKALLETKLNQITSNNGIGGSSTNPRFIITASVNIGTKDIVAGSPQMIALNIDLTLFIGDAIENKVFSNTTLSLKGVGTNENKAFIDALKTINPQNKQVASLIEEAKSKIVTYYNTQCDFIIKDAETLVAQQKFDEAIYKLSLVPEVCQTCYFKCKDMLASTYQQKINADCKVKLNNAKTIWATDKTASGAQKAGVILTEINPSASCYTEAVLFVKDIDEILKAAEKDRQELKLKKYNDEMAMRKDELKAYRDIAIQYAQRQPRTITYNNIYWR